MSITGAPMPRKFSVTLPDTVAVKLDRWSEARGQAFATVAAVAIELAVRQAESEGEIPKENKTTSKDGAKS